MQDVAHSISGCRVSKAPCSPKQTLLAYWLSYNSTTCLAHCSTYLISLLSLSLTSYALKIAAQNFKSLFRSLTYNRLKVLICHKAKSLTYLTLQTMTNATKFSKANEAPELQELPANTNPRSKAMITRLLLLRTTMIATLCNRKTSGLS